MELDIMKGRGDVASYRLADMCAEFWRMEGSRPLDKTAAHGQETLRRREAQWLALGRRQREMSQGMGNVVGRRGACGL